MTSRPIFGLLKRLEESVAREATLLMNHLGIERVSGLTGYSRPYLERIEVTPKVIGALESVLATHYDTKLATRTKPKEQKKPARRKRTQYRASGAPPRSVLEERVPYAKGLSSYLQ
jgi:hypothetical protein